ncbi:hypothetical protein [Carboxylicivirga caseinilyticus]|uniref:hypothetical protein n=1 Tax=Carboxylicivirga caseinilyticus TaxID=3417572 RepID=UPI003D3484E4|nr:hypothetical protein [Marinilabiliaceae bacterium A049]
MENFLKKIVQGSSFTPPGLCEQALKENFTEAINVEWINKEEYYEAIFYKNNIEHIALIDRNGNLLEYRQNIPKDFLPEQIKTIAQSKGEIMNSVLKNKGNNIEYEIILKDQSLKRYLVLFSEIGVIKDEKKL